MATKKVGVYRSYYGEIPKGESGGPLPKSQWPRKRPFSWVVRWHGVEGKRYSKSFRTKSEAERFAEEKQREVRQGVQDPPREITLKQFCKEHRQLMKSNVKDTTLAMHLAVIEQLAEHAGWQQPVGRIARTDIERFRAARLQTGIAPITANKDIKTLRRIFNLAIMRGYLRQGSNPCVGLPMIRTTPKLVNYCPPGEFQGLCGVIDTYWQAFVLTAYTAGLRLREAENLTWGDIDFERCRILIVRKEARGYVRRWEPKDYEIRTIPVPEQTRKVLAAWRAMAPEDCPYVFMDPGRWEYYRRAVDEGSWRAGQHLLNNVLRKFKTRCRQAGIGVYTIHDLRRSCITNWAAKLPIHVVQWLAGHSDIKTTQKYYLFVGDEEVARAREVQASLLGTMPTPRTTDQLLTNSAEHRRFPGKQGCQRKR